MNQNSNIYTFIFAAVMVTVVASVLAYTATSLQPLQNENVRKEKMQNILATVGIQVTRDEAEAKYEQYIKETISLKPNGEVDPASDAFQVDLNIELKKPLEKQRFPLYVAEVGGEQFYIIPLRGSGLWDAIWGYISLKDDLNTIKGAVFAHKAETPGLGAEITQVWFQERFADEKIFDESGNLIGVSVVKGYAGGNEKNDNKVNAISGATITGDGVTNMISERLNHYLPYLEKQPGFNIK